MLNDDQDKWRLMRFAEAQKPVYPRVLQELRAARKQSHWMWFIFPQIAGLGSSPISERYAISGKEEAAAYLKHAVLGPRLRECTELVLRAKAGLTAEQIFSYPDDLKFRSSMTLFAAVTHEDSLFQSALERFFGDDPDPATLRLIS